MKTRVEIKEESKQILKENYSVALLSFVLYGLLSAVAAGVVVGIGGLLMLRVCDSRLGTPAKVGCVLGICLLTFPSDWSCIAALCILSIGSNRGKPARQLAWSMFYMAIYAAVYFFALDKLYGLIQLCVVLSVPLIGLYNGKRGDSPRVSRFLGKFFYFYYPAHLLVIGIIRAVMAGH